MNINDSLTHLRQDYGGQAETINSDTVINYAYDDNGNLISKNDGSDSTIYEWNWDNKLTTVNSLPASGGTTTVNYEYDGDGNRISKTIDGVKTKYINDVGLSLLMFMETI